MQQLAEGWEDGLLLVLGLLLSRVLAMLAAAARGRRERRRLGQEQQQEQEQQQRRSQERVTVWGASLSLQRGQEEAMDQQQGRVMVSSPLRASPAPDFAFPASPREHGEEKAESEEQRAVAGAACGMS